VAVTAHADVSTKEKASKVGIKQVLSKPVEIE